MGLKVRELSSWVVCRFSTTAPSFAAGEDGPGVEPVQGDEDSQADLRRIEGPGAPRTHGTIVDKLIAQAKIEYPVFQEEAVATA